VRKSKPDKVVMWRSFLIVIGILLAIPGIFAGIIYLSTAKWGEVYETNDVADYGNITGNYDNESPQAFIFSFFPETMDESFSQVNYHYKAIYGGAYAYEAWLEFVIDDHTEFEAYVENLLGGKRLLPFPFDERYMVYDFEEASHKGIVLVSKQAQHLIFVAYGIHGDHATLYDLSYYLDQFNIGPIAKKENQTQVKQGSYYAVGDYEEMMTPYLSLNGDDHTFYLGAGALFSAAAYGTYEVKDSRLIAKSQVGTYVFEIMDSGSVVLIENGDNHFLQLPTYTEFVYKLR
jgi:hypothetical protein